MSLEAMQLQTHQQKVTTPSPASAILQRQCACGNHTVAGGECEACRKKRLVQRKAVDASDPSESVVSLPTTSGVPLPEEVRASMEKRFGVDFSQVRVHTDASTNRTAADLKARAFTQQHNIYFANGYYEPGSQTGLGLLAHELAHVVQQRGGRFPATTSSRVAQTRSQLEHEAEQIEQSVQASAAPLVVREAASEPEIQRKPGFLEKVTGLLPANLDELQTLATGSIEKMADYVIAKVGGTADELMRQLIELRAFLKQAGQTIELPVEVVAELEAAYNEVKTMAPGWIPKPTVSLSGPPTLQAAQTIPLAVIILLFIIAYMIIVYYANPETQKHVRRFVRELSKARPRPAPPQPTQKPKPDNDPKDKPKPKPDGPGPHPIPPKPQEPEKPKGPYPICWATQLGPVTQTMFVRTKSPERDLDEQENARMLLRFRGFRDPDFPPEKFHVHHVVPLFLGGPDDLKKNGTVLQKELHLKGHRVLQIQPQMVTPPPPLPPLPVDLYQHPPGITYRLVGYKKDVNEACKS